MEPEFGDGAGADDDVVDGGVKQWATSGQPVGVQLSWTGRKQAGQRKAARKRVELRTRKVSVSRALIRQRAPQLRPYPVVRPTHQDSWLASALPLFQAPISIVSWILG